MRKVEYKGGTIVRATFAEVAEAWRARSAVDVRYALGTAEHETNFAVNEVDTEESGFQSFGIYQVSLEEIGQAGPAAAGVDVNGLATLVGCTQVMAAITTHRVGLITAAAPREAQGDDLRAYLSIAHNQGLGACLKTIEAHGLDWAAYKDRNRRGALDEVSAAAPGTSDELRAKAKYKWWCSVFAYGDDCISGGDAWAALQATS